MFLTSDPLLDEYMCAWCREPVVELFYDRSNKLVRMRPIVETVYFTPEDPGTYFTRRRAHKTCVEEYKKVFAVVKRLKGNNGNA